MSGGFGGSSGGSGDALGDYYGDMTGHRASWGDNPFGGGLMGSALGGLYDAGTQQAIDWEANNPGQQFNWGEPGPGTLDSNWHNRQSNRYSGGYPGPGYPGGYGGWGVGGGTPQQQMWSWMAPTLRNAFTSGTPYNIPDVNMMLPSKSTFENIDPFVWEGIMHPYKQSEKQLMETLGAGGGLGSARGGFSGQGAAGLGKFWADASPTIGTTAWGMVGPQLQQNWLSNLQRNMYLPNLASSLVGGTYPTPVIKPEGPSTFDNLLGIGALAAQVYGGMGGGK